MVFPSRSSGGRVPGPLGLPGGDAERAHFARLPLDAGTRTRTRVAPAGDLALAAPAGQEELQALSLTPAVSEAEAALLISIENMEDRTLWLRTVNLVLAAARRAEVTTRAGLALFLAIAEFVEQIESDMDMASGAGGGGGGGGRVVASKTFSGPQNVTAGDGVHHTSAAKGGYRSEEGFNAGNDDEPIAKLRAAYEQAEAFYRGACFQWLPDGPEVERAFSGLIRWVETSNRRSGRTVEVVANGRGRQQRSWDAMNKYRYFRWVLGLDRPAEITENFAAI